MKNRLLLILAGVIFLIAGGYYFFNFYLKINPRSVIENVKPPSEDIAKLLPQGSDVSFPLEIPDGYRIAVYADLKNVGSPRVLAFDPEGNLLVTIPSKGKVVALPDKNSDGVVDDVVEVLSNLDKPHGIDFTNGKIYIAETEKVISYDYDPKNFKAKNPNVLFELPPGGRHFTRTIKVFEDNLYTSVGSSCDTCIESDWRRSSILVSDIDGSDLRTFAKGLRNTVFFVFDPTAASGQVKIWGNDMGRDYLGDNLPPDEVNIIEKDKDYGWPWCYGDKVRDTKFQGNQNQNYCDRSEGSSFDYPAHVAPLGITFINSPLFPDDYQGDILSALHGSWNSSVPVGYKIVRLKIKEGKITTMEDFITGFLRGREVLGRPVDVVFDNNGILFVSDDKANLIYILTKP